MQFVNRELTVIIIVICSGFINTPMTETVPEKVRDMVTASIALRRFGEPVEIADAVAFLGELNALKLKSHKKNAYQNSSPQHPTKAHT